MIMTVVLLAGCSNDDPTLADNSEYVPLRIAASIDAPTEGITRAVNTAWEREDKIGVFITERNSTTKLYKDTYDTEGQNLLYTFNDGTNYETYGNTYRLFSPAKKIFLSSDPVDVYGYYPYRAQDSNGDEVDDLPPTAIPIDVSNQTRQESIDFMRAKTSNVSNGNATIDLMFYHRLVKLVFNLKQGEGLLTDELKDASFLGMTIGSQPTTATYNIYTDAFIITAGNDDIVPVRAASATSGYVRTFEAIVLPNGANNPVSDRTVTITFYRRLEDQIVNTFTIPSGTYFEAGKKYTYNVTVNATSIHVDKQIYTEQW